MQEQSNLDDFNDLIQEQNQDENRQTNNLSNEDFEAGVLAQLDSLYRTALRMTNNTQEAEDLVQETMLKAFRFAHTYQPGTNLGLALPYSEYICN
jgi:RNA polymerase sigma-70 factor (ECF subfamily)